MNYMFLARLRDSFGLALLSILFVASVYRAWSLSISMDEAHTYLSFVAPPLTQILTTYSPNHHVLFSLLAKASIQTFGVSELSLRLPALLGCLLFFSATWGIGRVLFEDRSTMLLSLCLVTLNPLTFDYMSQARGYSLALGFYLFGVLSLIRFPLTESSNRKSSRLVLAGLPLGLAVAANLAFGIPVLALNLLFGAALAGRLSALKAMSWLFCSESIAFCAIAGSPLLHADRGEFIGGFASVFDTLSNFSIACLIHDWDGNGVWTKPINVWTSYFLYPAFRIVVLIVLGTVTCLLAGYLWRRLKPRPPNGFKVASNDYWLFFFGGSLILSVAMLIVAHSAADAPYPFARMVIYCWPLLVFTMCLLIERFHTGKMVLRLFSTLLLLFSLIIVIQSGLQFDMDHFGWLEYSAGTKQAARIIRDREADSPREVSISTSWSLYACLNYYESVYSMKRWRLKVRSASTQPDDYLVIDVFEARNGVPPGYRQVWRDPLSGAVLAVPLGGTKGSLGRETVPTVTRN
jgi:hypothetical protein